jgi:preprotein translocase subunit YajC
MLGDTLAYAQDPAPGGEAPAILQFGPLVIILGLAYVLLIRPQRQQERTHRTMLANLKRNDEVMTSGGIYGRVVALTEGVVTLEIAPSVQIRVERNQIKTLARQTAGEDKERRRDREREKDREKGRP